MMPDRCVVESGLPHTAGGASSGRFHCVHCQTDITFLPPVARFCSHCGVRLSPGRQRTAAAPRCTSFWRYWWWGGAPRAQESSPRVGDRSSMLVAYAKSMFGLGWRYEHAVGSRRNLAEAARCYWKAARLGDRDAAQRLVRPVSEDQNPVILRPPLPPLPHDWQSDAAH